MHVCMGKWCAEQLAKALSLIERVNNMSHNETTWERKQALIADGLGIVKDLLATSVEYDITEHAKLTRQAMDIAERVMDATTAAIASGDT